MSNKNFKKVTIYKDEVIQSNSSKVIRKRFLNDLAININKFRSNSYDNIVQQVEKNGIKKNIKLFNQIKDFVYGENKSKITLKSIKADVQDAKMKNIEAIFPFADDVYEKSNQSISTIKPSKVFPFSNDIFDAVNSSPVKSKDETVYTIYAKIKVISDASDNPSKNTKQIYYKQLVDGRRGEDTEVYADEYYNQFQFDVTGRGNIRNELKAIIDGWMARPYIIRVDVVNLSINKHIKMNKNEYRWKGVEHNYKDSGKNEIVYYKAWNSEFQYFGYDLDLNNETPFQCVDNAIFNMYGNRQTTKRDGFLAWIADGGIDAVSAWFDGEEPENPLDFGVDMEKSKRGRSSFQILEFCNVNKIRCFGYDWKFNQFITNKKTDIKFNNDLPAFVFYFNDEHIYLINDQSMRQSLLHKSDKANIQSIVQKKQQSQCPDDKNNTIDASKLLIDIPFEEWTKYEKSTIYITTHRLINDVFYKEISAGRIHNKKIKLSEKDGITQFQYYSNTIVYNKDIKDVLDTLKNLDETKYKFQNQKLNSLAKEVLDKQFSGLPSSTMNKNGDKIFHSDFIRNCQYNGWLSKYEDENKCVGYDYNKHYTSCLTQDVKYGFPIYSVFDEVKTFDGLLEAGFFYVETNNFFPYRGNGYYDADLVAYGVESRIISIDDIKYQYKSSRSLPTNYFNKFVEFVYKNFTVPKDAINAMIGCFGHDFKNMNIHNFTSDARLVFREIVENQSAQVKNVYHQDFMDVEKEINVDTMDPNDYVNETKPLCYHVFNNSRMHHFHNSLPIFYKIYNMSAVKMHKMANSIGGIVRGVFTDTIIFENAVNKPHCDASLIGGIREAPVKTFTQCMFTEPRKIEYKKLDDQSLSLKPIDDFSLTKGKGCFFKGMGGTGKSYKVNEIQKELKPEQFIVCTPTHKSALIVNGCTIYNAFDIDYHDHT